MSRLSIEGAPPIVDTRCERTEVGVLHGLACGDSLGVVVAQHLVEQVERLWRHQVLVL